MSEPDKAILWARERAARWQDESGGEAGPSYRSGKLDFLLGEEVEGYRAGQAASAERIKALEEAIRRLTNMLAEIDDPPGLIMVVTKDLLDARNLLKEADQ